jgi:dihydrofolate reductase
VSRLVARCIGISIDGFVAGARQSLENPLGVRGPELMDWVFHTRTWHRMHGETDGGETGVDDDMAARGFENIGAWIIGRNMFGPIRGPWPDESWRGWWGEEPPYHTPVFVLTHHARAPLRMAGGTEFRFVTDGIHAALRQAKDAAVGKDIRVGGGALTIREYLQAELLDELHLAVRPVVLGEGESLFQGLDVRALGYRGAESVAGGRATHVILRRNVAQAEARIPESAGVDSLRA